MTPDTWRVATITVYLVLALALVGLEVLARTTGAVPRLGTLTAWAMRHRATQLGLLLAWWWLGWHLILAT